MRRLIHTGLTLLVAAGLSACGGSTAPPIPAGGEPLRVVATTTQIADFARNIGGDRIQLTALLKPNVDPHEYEPTPSAAEAVANATVVLRSGAGLDDWITKVRTGAGGAARMVTTTDDVALRGDDPHVWMDTRNAEVMVESIRDALSTADPAGARVYDTNAARYSATIRALDRELRNLISAVPHSKRTLVTDHDAFGYFAPRYGIRIVGAAIGSLSTSAEPDARHLAELVRTIRRQHVAVVFAEESVDPALAKSLANDAGIAVGAGLYADSLGPSDGPAGTYVGMMRQDMERMVAGFLAR